MKNILKINKRIFSALALLGVIVLMSSCKNDLMNVTYTPDNNSVTFASSSAYVSLPVSEGTFTVAINRGIANEAISVAVSLSDDNGIFSLSNTSVGFSTGEFTQVVTVNYDADLMLPGVTYPLSLSFNEDDKAITGYCTTDLSAMLVLEYEEYGLIAPYSGTFFSLMPADNFYQKLYKAIGTTNIYKVEDFYGSGSSVEFGINDGAITFYSPDPSYYSVLGTYPLICMVSAMVHPSYGTMTAWVDTDPDYVQAYYLGDDDMLINGSIIGADVFYTVSAGYFGWYTDYLVVSDVN